MPRKNIEDVYDNIYDMLDLLEKLSTKATDLVALAGNYSGDIKRVLTEQMQVYFIPTIQKLKDDENTPGCLKAQLTFLDSISLGQMRLDPSESDYSPDPEVVNTTNPETLPASSTVDQTSEIPQNASYNNPQGIQTQVQESTLQEKHTTYCIKRKGIENSALGDDVGNIEPHIVNEYRTRAEADLACDKLNKGVLPGEKEILGTEYFVDEIEFGDDNLIDKD